MSMLANAGGTNAKDNTRADKDLFMGSVSFRKGYKIFSAFLYMSVVYDINLVKQGFHID